MAYKLIDAAAARWRAVNAPHLVALVRAGAVFHKGKLSSDGPGNEHGRGDDLCRASSSPHPGAHDWDGTYGTVQC